MAVIWHLLSAKLFAAAGKRRKRKRERFSWFSNEVYCTPRFNWWNKCIAPGYPTCSPLCLTAWQPCEVSQLFIFSHPLNVAQRPDLMMQLWMTAQHGSSQMQGGCYWGDTASTVRLKLQKVLFEINFETSLRYCGLRICLQYVTESRCHWLLYNATYKLTFTFKHLHYIIFDGPKQHENAWPNLT